MRHIGLPYLIALLLILSFSQTATCFSSESPREFALTQAERSWIAEHPVINVRISNNYPPFEFFDNGTYQGLAYDYLMAIGQKVGLTFQPVAEMAWSDALQQIEDKNGIDLILLITHTQERESFLNFTRDYISFPEVIFTRKDGLFVSGFDDLEGQLVATENGFVESEKLLRDISQVRLFVTETTSQALEAVATGKADAYVGNLAVGSYLIDKLGLADLKIAAPAPYGDDSYAMGVRKDWPELTNILAKGLDSLTTTDHQEIKKKWFAIRYEHGIGAIDIVKWTLIVVSIALLWVTQLRLTVKRRTAELQREVLLRQEKEHALELQTAQMNAIFDSLEAVVYVADMESLQILYLNKHGRFLFGDDWEGKTCFEVLQGSQASPCPFCPNDKLVVEGEPQPPYLWEHYNEKTDQWYQCIDRAIPWPDGRLVKMEIATDITERKEIDRLKDEMICVVGHEVRTPITAMIGYAELMMDTEVSPEQRQDYLGVICQESERLAELFDNFFDLQNIKNDNVSPTFHPIKVEEMINKAIALFRGASRKHHIAFDCHEYLPEINGDTEMLHKVFLNLISNAIKYSPDGGLINIAAYLSGSVVIIKVTDEGLGIAPSAQERIFESFYRVDNRNNRSIGGTGLGLPLVRGTVNLHGGRVWVESQVSKGSSFFVSLPICDPTPSEIEFA